MTLILASKSTSRGKLLKATGVDFEVKASNVDEGLIKTEMFEKGSDFKAVTERLAFKKALTISEDYPDDYVIGADQMLICKKRAFDKAKTIEEAADHLRFFRGKTHSLVTSVCLVKNREQIWMYTSEPKLTMRHFSDPFLEHYMENAGDALLHSVGAYFLEDIGISLFSKVDGDYYDILGLPLLPLLETLRDLKIIND